MITVDTTGSFDKMEKFLHNMSQIRFREILDHYGQVGVDALASATPVRSGLTAASWTYKISQERGSTILTWLNSNVHNGVPIAIILQYGHGTGTGGYVRGYDYINPAIRPVFDMIADAVWNEVKNG
ncbi:MAG TPA: HK97 gp10 family phage protein [Pyrinomonadaceae bacterium]